MWWWYGHGLGIIAAAVWLSAVIYLLTLATRLVRAVERIAAKLDSKAV